MIGLNYELEQREASGNPVRVGLVGAGQMGTDVVATTKMMKGLRVVVTADLDIERAIAAYKIAQIEGEVFVAENAEQADAAVAAGKLVAVRDYRIVTDMKISTSCSKPPALPKSERVRHCVRPALVRTWR